jgi:hypothetical protein
MMGVIVRIADIVHRAQPTDGRRAKPIPQNADAR